MRVLLWLDALGMAAYSVVGAAKALALGVPPFSAVLMGVMTACFGGIVRDVLAHEPSVLLRREIYVTCALAGASLFVVLYVLAVQSAQVSWAVDGVKQFEGTHLELPMADEIG